MTIILAHIFSASFYSASMAVPINIHYFSCLTILLHQQLLRSFHACVHRISRAGFCSSSLPPYQRTNIPIRDCAEIVTYAHLWQAQRIAVPYLPSTPISSRASLKQPQTYTTYPPASTSPPHPLRRLCRHLHCPPIIPHGRRRCEPTKLLWLRFNRTTTSV